jgi:2-keto-3-deoxy-6-phosphogluconate aldolase
MWPSLLGPFPDLIAVATGRIGAEDAADFLGAGAVAVGVGGWLTGHHDLGVITERTAELVAVCSVG